MNAVLNECGFSELYMGNPFDWMFLYCTLEDNPLDTFRGLLAEALEQDNQSTKVTDSHATKVYSIHHNEMETRL